MTLRLVPAYVDRELPVAWDGEEVRWGEPTPVGAVFICPPPKATPCPQCGNDTTRYADSYTGRMRSPDEPAYWTRNKWGQPVRKPGWEVWSARLVLTRCGRCGHDQVTDLESDETWDLDESDYGETGSWDGEPTLF